MAAAAIFAGAAPGAFADRCNPLSWRSVHPMTHVRNVRLRLPLAALLAWSAATVASAADEFPWRESFAMQISGQERTFASYHGGSYLVLSPADAANHALLLGRKDVVLTAKFERDGVTGTRQRVRLSGFPEVVAEGDTQLFAARLEGDNLYFFGTLTMLDEGKGRLEIAMVEAAPSDAQIIERQLAHIAPSDYAGRIKAAGAVRDRAQSQPNKEFWLSAADNVVAQAIDDAAAAAEKAKDPALVNQAITWAIDALKDPTKAGRIASAAWLRAPGQAGADELAKRMRRLGLEMYKDQWRPRIEALSMEYEDRFAAINWKDADSYYRLGRWADLNGEFLPRARDRSYRCYQAGYRANPNHQGIRNELGLPNSVRGDGTQATVTADYQHSVTGALVPAPQGWKRGDRIEGDITWIDPSSETTYIAASVIETPDSMTMDNLWSGVISSLRVKPEFQIIEEEEPLFPQGIAKRLRFTFRDGRYVRSHETILAFNTQAHAAVRLDAGFADEEAATVHAAVLSTFDRLVIPNTRPNQIKP